MVSDENKPMSSDENKELTESHPKELSCTTSPFTSTDPRYFSRCRAQRELRYESCSHYSINSPLLHLEVLLTERSLGALKKQLLPAIQPLADTLPSPPRSEADIQLYEDKPILDGSQEKAGQLRSVEDDQKTRSLAALGWDRWKKIYVR